MSLLLECLLSKRHDVKPAAYLNCAKGILNINSGICSLRKVIVWKSYTRVSKLWQFFIILGWFILLKLNPALFCNKNHTELLNWSKTLGHHPVSIVHFWTFIIMRSTAKPVSNQWLQTLRFLQRCSFMSQTGSALDWDEKKVHKEAQFSQTNLFSPKSLSLFSLPLAQTFPWLPHFLPLQSATRNHLRELSCSLSSLNRSYGSQFLSKIQI